MAGKMSMFIREKERAPSTSISSAITATVSGRRSASSTSHIIEKVPARPFPRPGLPAHYKHKPEGGTERSCVRYLIGSAEDIQIGGVCRPLCVLRRRALLANPQRSSPHIFGGAGVSCAREFVFATLPTASSLRALPGRMAGESTYAGAAFSDTIHSH